MTLQPVFIQSRPETSLEANWRNLEQKKLHLMEKNLCSTAQKWYIEEKVVTGSWMIHSAWWNIFVIVQNTEKNTICRGCKNANSKLSAACRATASYDKKFNFDFFHLYDLWHYNSSIQHKRHFRVLSTSSHGCTASIKVQNFILQWKTRLNWKPAAHYIFLKLLSSEQNWVKPHRGIQAHERLTVLPGCTRIPEKQVLPIQSPTHTLANADSLVSKTTCATSHSADITLEIIKR